MSIPLAAFTVIIIWSTTALAVKWSMDQISFLTAAGLRMAIASLLCTLVLRVMGWPFPLHRRALAVYAFTGAGLFCGLGGTYWAAQYLSSGLISVGWGLLPLFTGLIAAQMLNERLGGHEILGLVAATAGLWLTFAHGEALGARAVPALLVLLGVLLVQALCMVLLKRWSGGIDAFAVTTGSIAVAALLFGGGWLLFDRHVPQDISRKALMSILYLASIGNLLGLGAYNWLVKRVAAAKAALVTLMTPVLALALGHYLNAEALTPRMLVGIVLVFAGLVAYQRPWIWLRRP